MVERCISIKGNLGRTGANWKDVWKHDDILWRSRWFFEDLELKIRKDKRIVINKRNRRNNRRKDRKIHKWRDKFFGYFASKSWGFVRHKKTGRPVNRLKFRNIEKKWQDFDIFFERQHNEELNIDRREEYFLKRRKRVANFDKKQD